MAAGNRKSRFRPVEIAEPQAGVTEGFREGTNLLVWNLEVAGRVKCAAEKCRGFSVCVVLAGFGPGELRVAERATKVGCDREMGRQGCKLRARWVGVTTF